MLEEKENLIRTKSSGLTSPMQLIDSTSNSNVYQTDSTASATPKYIFIVTKEK